MMKKIRSLVITMLVLSITVQTNIVYGQINLNELVRYALEHSRDIKKSDLQIEEAKYLHKETLGQGLPQIEASGKYNKMMIGKIDIPAEITGMIPEEYAPMLEQVENIDALYIATAGVQVTQLIYSQSYWEGLKTTKKTQELYELLKNKTEDDVIEEVANSYYQTLSLMLQLKTLEKSLVNLNELYRIVDLNYKNDFVKESDVNRLKVSITNIEVNQQTIKNVIDIQLNYLKALAGMPSDTVITIDSSFMNYDISASGINPMFTIENVPAYQVLLKQKELNAQQVKLEKARYYPTLAAFGQFNYSSYNTSTDIEKWRNMNTIGMQLNIPIFSSGVNYAKVKQANLKKAQTEETILKTKDLLTVGYKSAFSEYQTAINLLNVQEENRDLALKVYNQTTSLYKEGMASMADVLNSNSDFLQAENSYDQQILKYKLSEVKIMKSSGKLKQFFIAK